MDTNARTLHALLYTRGGEMKRSELASLLGLARDDLQRAVDELRRYASESGLVLIETDTTVSLRTAESCADTIDDIHRTERERDVGAAGLEVLAIVLYKGGASRAEIDYLRGVNSSTTLRQLVLRGLLERTRDSTDARAWLYRATPELLSHIGVSSREELPEYAQLSAALADTRGEHNTHDDTSDE